MNYLALHDYRKAITLALAMEQPGRLLSLFRELRNNNGGEIIEPSLLSITGSVAVDEVVRTLAGAELAKLLRYVRDWNARVKTAGVAQEVLFAIMKLRPAEEVLGAFGGGKNTHEEPNRGQAEGAGTALKDILDGLIPYTERHLARMERLVQESYVVDYLLAEMDDGMFMDGDNEMDVDGGGLSSSANVAIVT
jgi:U3 small nucleolar RNA-associated protein 13